MVLARSTIVAMRESSSAPCVSTVILRPPTSCTSSVAASPSPRASARRATIAVAPVDMHSRRSSRLDWILSAATLCFSRKWSAISEMEPPTIASPTPLSAIDR